MATNSIKTNATSLGIWFQNIPFIAEWPSSEMQKVLRKFPSSVSSIFTDLKYHKRWRNNIWFPKKQYNSTDLTRPKDNITSKTPVVSLWFKTAMTRTLQLHKCKCNTPGITKDPFWIEICSQKKWYLPHRAAPTYLSFYTKTTTICQQTVSPLVLHLISDNRTFG